MIREWLIQYEVSVTKKSIGQTSGLEPVTYYTTQTDLVTSYCSSDLGLVGSVCTQKFNKHKKSVIQF